MHPLSSVFLSLICSWLNNNSTSLLLSMSVYPSFFKNNRAFYISLDFRFEKRLFLKYFENDFKIFRKYFLIVIVLYIFRISLCVTSPLERKTKLINCFLYKNYFYWVSCLNQLTRDHIWECDKQKYLPTVVLKTTFKRF